MSIGNDAILNIPAAVLHTPGKPETGKLADYELVGDTYMKIVKLIMEDGSPQEFFLAPYVYETLVAYVGEQPRLIPAPLIVAGPIRSSKTTMLSHILPYIVKAEDATPRIPIFIRITFNNSHAPENATRKIYIASMEAAAEVGIIVSQYGDTDLGILYDMFPVRMHKIATAFNVNGYLPYFILDGLQVS
jgi:hypothetical protein